MTACLMRYCGTEKIDCQFPTCLMHDIDLHTRSVRLEADAYSNVLRFILVFMTIEGKLNLEDLASPHVILARRGCFSVKQSLVKVLQNPC